MNEHVYNVTANKDSLYYIQTDLCGGRAQSQTCLGYAETEQSVRSNILGSWDRVVDCRKNIVQSSHFDPWGNRMSASDWTSNQDGSTFQFHRGFTGHEHYFKIYMRKIDPSESHPRVCRKKLHIIEISVLPGRGSR